MAKKKIVKKAARPKAVRGIKRPKTARNESGPRIVSTMRPSVPDEEDVLVDWMLETQLDALDQMSPEELTIENLEIENILSIIQSTRERKLFLPNRDRLIRFLQLVKANTEEMENGESLEEGTDSGPAPEAPEDSTG